MDNDEKLYIFSSCILLMFHACPRCLDRYLLRSKGCMVFFSFFIFSLFLSGSHFSGKYQVLIPNYTIQYVSDAIHITIPSLHNVGKVIRHELDSTDESLLVELAVSTIRRVINSLQSIDLSVAQTGIRSELLVSDDRLRDRLAKKVEFSGRTLEVDAGGLGHRVAVDKVDLGCHGSTVQ